MNAYRTLDLFALRWHYSIPSFRAMQLPAKVIEKRRRLFGVGEIAHQIEVSASTIRKLERDPLAVQGRTLRAYLLLLGWRLRVAKDFRRSTKAMSQGG